MTMALTLLLTAAWMADAGAPDLYVKILRFQPRALAADWNAGVNVAQLGRPHSAQATVSPLGGAFGSLIVTPSCVGGEVGGIGTLLAAWVLLTVLPADVPELVLLLDPQAARTRPAAVATNSPGPIRNLVMRSSPS